MKKCLVLALLFFTISCGDVTYWDLVVRSIYSLAITNSTAWIVNSANPITGGYKLRFYSYTTQTWADTTLGCIQVALSTLNLYCVQTDGTVIKVASQGFGVSTTLLFKANDIKANTFGHVWYVSQTSTTPGDYTVYQYNESTGLSTLASGTGAAKVAPTPDGYAWIVTSSHVIKKYDGST